MSIVQLKALGLRKIKIEPTTVMLKSYTGDKLQVNGMCKLKVKKRDKIFNLDFYVVNTNTPAILGLESCLKLNIIKKIDNR